MEEKIKRFVELSLEFTVSGKEIYKDFTNTHYGGGNFIFTGGSCGSISLNPVSTPTQLETLEKNLLEISEKAKRYEEYLELQILLSEYYKALNNLK